MERFRLALGVLAVVIASSAASAQTATVNGRVSNAQGGVISGADVTLRQLPPPGTPVMPRMPNMPNMPGMAERTTRTANDGTFSIGQVAAGQYVLQVDFSGFERSSQELTVTNQPPAAVAVILQPLEVPGAEAAASPGTAGRPAETTEALLARIRTLEQRIADLESSAVLSEPETRPKRIEMYVDKNGNITEDPTPGAKKEVTYQRERVYRRQTINEKLEAALADQDAKKITVGVSAASVTQFAGQTSGERADADRHAYQLSSADLFFSAGLAQYTSFFADIVGLSGSPPDEEIKGLTLLNSYTARLVRQNEVNVREAWVRTELFGQKLGISAGRLDLTNFFDRNAFANDETTQFISDALVNNPTLGLGANGAGVAAVFDPKNGFAFKAGFQQSSDAATNLSQSLYSLFEVDYIARPPGLSEGNYRAWFRNDNSSGINKSAFGVSVDQKLSPLFGVFGRFGAAQACQRDVLTQECAEPFGIADSRDRFFSVGFQVQNGLVFTPLDAWGIGYAQTTLETGDRERIAEGYYNFRISDKLRLSLHLQHVFETPFGESSVGFLVPAVRVQARF
jgi:hypothetical protein